MKTNLLILFLLIFNQIAVAQIVATIRDGETGEEIPFVNILFENEWVGVSADHMGKFAIADPETPKVLVFSAVGYEILKIRSDNVPKTILLRPQAIELKEAIVSGRKKRSRRARFPFFEADTDMSYRVCNGFPWMSAKFYAYQQNYKRTPFIDGLEVFTITGLDSARFSVRLCLPDKSGKPGEYLIDQPIVAIATKGQPITKVDLSDEYIVFPEEGFFVILEWLIIDENKKIYSTQYRGEKGRQNRTIIEPIFGAVPSENSTGLWRSVGGGWVKPQNENELFGDTDEKAYQYQAPAVNLLLSN